MTELEEAIYNLTRESLLYAKALRDKAELVVKYNVQIGPTEIKKVELTIDVFKLKRELDIMQAYVKSHEPIEHTKIDEAIDSELNKILEEYDKMKKFYEISKEISGDSDLTEAENEEIDSLYFQLVGKFNPILIGDTSPHAKKRYDDIQDAYINYDLEAIRDYSLIQFEVNSNPDIFEVNKEIEALKEKISVIQSEFPYTLLNQDGVLDLNNRIAQSKTEINELQMERDLLAQKIEELEPMEGLAS